MTIQGGPKLDVLLTALLQLWLKFRAGIDKYWIVPVRKLCTFTTGNNSYISTQINGCIVVSHTYSC